MKRFLLTPFILSALAATGAAQQRIRVNPDGVNVNSQGATIVYLSYGGIGDYRPAEATWCGELIPAASGIGFQCNPATVFGQLPSRYDRSRLKDNISYTDIMTIPPSVARRAYQAAVGGQTGSFFYVRRFVSASGAPDQYVVVTCRMAGGGARVPFALTDVKLSFAVEKEILLVKAGETLPRVKAEIAYNGTGRLKGRWEVVLPGEEPPTERDLLTEATLPMDERGSQRRFTEVSRFNVFLPPTGKYVLPGPDPARLPTRVEGPYLLLLRVEASDDREADSNLAAVGAGPGVVHSGAVAGFPLPALRYYVGSGTGGAQPAGGLRQLAPDEGFVAPAGGLLDFTWAPAPVAQFYRLEVADAQQSVILSALLPQGVGTYRAPSWLKDKVTDGDLRWRVVALDAAGAPISETPWRGLRLTK